MAQITDGKVRYIVVSALSPEGLVLDISGLTTANKANAMVFKPNGGNNQLFRFQPYNGTLTCIRSCFSGKAVEVFKALDKNGANVSQYDWNKTPAQRWYLIADGKTVTVNGHSYPTYLMVALGKTNGRVMHAASAARSTGSHNVEIQPRTGSANQRFAMVPSSQWISSYAVPANGKAATSQTGTASNKIVSANANVYPSWTLDTNNAQVRYRTRTRAESATSAAMGGWTRWRSLVGASDACWGWGDTCFVHTTCSYTGGRRCSPNYVTCNLGSTLDRMDVQFEVRKYVAEYGGDKVPAHGGSYTFDVSVVRPVTIDSLTMDYSLNGVRVNWSTSHLRQGYTVKVECPSLFPTITLTAPGTPSTTVPQSRLYHVPAEGETVNVKLTITSRDGVSATRTVSTTVSYDENHGEGVALTQAVSDDLVTVTGPAGSKAWLVIPRGHGSRYVPLAGSSPWKFPPPLGVPYKVYATQESGSSWNTGVTEFPAIIERPPTYHITSQNLKHDLAISYRVDNPGPEFTPTYTRSKTETETFGRERPVYGFGATTKAEWTISGDLIGGDQLGEVDYFAHDSHVYFRSPNGFWAQCAVDSVDVDLTTTDRHEVSVALLEEVW